MYYSDLSEYRYLSTPPDGHLPFEWNDDLTPLNVGWLGEDVPFPVGDVDASINDALRQLCFRAVNATRGGYFCKFCHYEDPPRVEWKGMTVGLGSAEIWVPGQNGRVYASPDLIYHYVTVHRYLPPEEYLLAVRDIVRGLNPP